MHAFTYNMNILEVWLYIRVDVNKSNYVLKTILNPMLKGYKLLTTEHVIQISMKSSEDLSNSQNDYFFARSSHSYLYSCSISNWRKKGNRNINNMIVRKENLYMRP